MSSPSHLRTPSSPRSPLIPLERRISPPTAAKSSVIPLGPPLAPTSSAPPPTMLSPLDPSAPPITAVPSSSSVPLATPSHPAAAIPSSTAFRRASAASLPESRRFHMHSSISNPSLRVGDAISDNAAPRNIVICLDGTGNQFSARNSNVIKMLSVLEADETQLLYYSSGVGTVLPDHASTWGKVRAAVAETTDKMLAWNHTDFLCNAYKYLMDYYRAGDKVYIFGFSRGAYTARALGGMIQKVGLLPPGNHNQIKLAYEVYLRPSMVKTRGGMANMKDDPAIMYRQIFGISRAVRIEFLGVWDTVSSLGGLFLPRLPHAGNVKSVKFFRQALALDERRVRFAPEYRYLFNSEAPAETCDVKCDLLAARAAYARLHSSDCTPQERYNAREDLKGYIDGDHPTVAMTDPIQTVSAGEGGLKQKIWKKNKEVWFMGCHSDVGGGNDENGKESLANIPFRWMLREAVRCGVKLEAAGVALQPALYKSELVHRAGLIPDELITILKDELRGDIIEFDNESRVRTIIDQTLPYSRLIEIVELAAAYDTAIDQGPPGSQQGMPMGVDAMQDYKESLSAWWAPLEVTLLETRRYGGGLGEDRDVWRLNLGRGRQIVPGHAIHKSVLKRLRYDRPVGMSEDDAESIASEHGVAPGHFLQSATAGKTQYTSEKPGVVRADAKVECRCSRQDCPLRDEQRPGTRDLATRDAGSDSNNARAAPDVPMAPPRGPTIDVKAPSTDSSAPSSARPSEVGSPTRSAFRNPPLTSEHLAIQSAEEKADKNHAGNKTASRNKGANASANSTVLKKAKGLFKIGDSSQSLRGIRGSKEKKLYLEPKAQLPVEWGTSWEGLRRGEGPLIWED